MKKSELSDLIDGSHRVETVIAPAADDWIDETELAPPEIRSETPAEPAVEEPGETAPAAASAPAVYAWPVLGEIAREYTVSALRYDETMRDWRTHSGVDIACDSGAKVFASRGGKTKELLPILDICRKKGVHVITVTENLESPLAQGAEVVLKQHVNRETDKYNCQGTTSSTALCMIFHILQTMMIEETDYQVEQFAVVHPGGAVGERLNGKETIH
jgi:hypothetical protein